MGYRSTVRARALRWWGGAFVALAGVVALIGSHLDLADPTGSFQMVSVRPLWGVGDALDLTDLQLVRAIGLLLAVVGACLAATRQGPSALPTLAVVGSVALVVLALNLWRHSAAWEVIELDSGTRFGFTRGTGLYSACVAAVVSGLGAALTLAGVVVAPTRYAADDLEGEATQDDSARGDVQVGE